MFNSFDVVVLILVSAGAYQGYRIGIISAAVFTAAGAAGTWLIRKFLPQSGMSLPLLYLLVLAAFMMFYRWYKAKEIEKKYKLITDRVLGGVTGALIILIMIGTVVLPFMHQLPGPSKETVFNSYSAMNIIPAVQQFFPETQASLIGKVHGVIVILQRGSIPEHKQKPKKKPSRIKSEATPA